MMSGNLEKNHDSFMECEENESSIGNITAELRDSFIHSDSNDSNATGDVTAEMQQSDELVNTNSNSSIIIAANNCDQRNFDSFQETIIEDTLVDESLSKGHSNGDANFEVSDDGNSDNVFSYESSFEDYLYDELDDIDVELEERQAYDNDGPFYYTNLLEFLKKPENNEIITENVAVSKLEMLLMMLTFVKRFNLPMDSTVSLCKMINSFFNKQIIPESRYFIDKYFYPTEGIEYHAICPTCKGYINKFQRDQRYLFCVNCEMNINIKNPSFTNFFVLLDVQNEIKHLIENNSEFYNSIVNSIPTRSNSTVRDIFDGLCYQNFIASLSNVDKNNYATITFNSDGSPTFKSSKYSVWPIQIILNEIPINSRNNPITVGLWFGHDKPNMLFFLRSFVEYMNVFSQKGIRCIINNEERNIKIYALCCCVDSVARATMQGIVQFNGFFGCNWCLQRGESVQIGRGHALKYPIPNENELIELRTEENTLIHLEEALRTQSVIKGVKTASPLLNLNGFNIVNGFVPDYMHCIALGIAKQFTEYWFSSSGYNYSLSKEDIRFLQEQLISFKIPCHLSRLSRSIEYRNFWKAREWENWLLFYSLPLLYEISLQKPSFAPYVEHWSLLTQAFSILISDNIKLDDLTVADQYLREFVAKTELYYSKTAMTFNVHQLIHITQSVCNWGPLWAHNGYPFESGNGQIVRTIHAAKGVIHQICRNILMKNTILIMSDYIRNNKIFSLALKYSNELLMKNTNKTIKVTNCRYFGISSTPESIIPNEIGLSEDTKAYKRIVFNNCLYQSKNKILNRSNNSCILLKNGEFGHIIEFLIDQVNNKEIITYNKIEVSNELLSTCTYIKKVISIDENVSFVKINSIEKICILMVIKEHSYISPLPTMIMYS